MRSGGVINDPIMAAKFVYKLTLYCYLSLYLIVNNLMLSLKTNQELLREFADKCRRLRLSQNMSQQELAARAGISLRTYRRFEQEGQISLERFVAVARALNRLPELEKLLESPPIADLRELDKPKLQRKRAGRRK